MRDYSPKPNFDQCEPTGALLAGADAAGAEVLAGAAGTSEPAAFPDAGAVGTSEGWAGTPDCAALLAGALPSGGAASGLMFGEVRAAADDEAAGAELPAPAITPSACCVFGTTP